MPGVWTASQNLCSHYSFPKPAMHWSYFSISGSSKDSKTASEAANVQAANLPACRLLLKSDKNELIAAIVVHTLSPISIFMLIQSISWYSVHKSHAASHSICSATALKQALPHKSVVDPQPRFVGPSRAPSCSSHSKCSSPTLQPWARRPQPRSQRHRSTSQRSCQSCTALRCLRALKGCSHPRTRRRAPQ